MEEPPTDRGDGREGHRWLTADLKDGYGVMTLKLVTKGSWEEPERYISTWVFYPNSSLEMREWRNHQLIAAMEEKVKVAQRAGLI
jgi:hypothetical protein